MLTALLADTRERDFVSPQRMSRRLRLPLAELAKLAHVHRNTLAQRPDSPVVQKRPVVPILTAAEQLTGDADRAIVWFRHQPIAGHDGRTALELVEAGHADAIMAHLEDLRDGAYARLGGSMPPGRSLSGAASGAWWRLDGHSIRFRVPARAIAGTSRAKPPSTSPTAMRPPLPSISRTCLGPAR